MNTSLNTSSQINEGFSGSLQLSRNRRLLNCVVNQAFNSQVLDPPPHLQQENFQYPSIGDKKDNPIAIPLLNSNKIHLSCSQHTQRNQMLISQNSTPTASRPKLGKRMTLNIDQIYQQPQSSFNFKGSLTSRSQTHKLTFTKIGSTLLETSIKEQAQLFKQIEQKALNLKKKEKRQREILKQLKKQKDTKNEQQMINHSLQIITPQKSKRNHRRAQSYNIQSIFQGLTPSCQIKDGQKQGQQFGENTKIQQQFQSKETQTDEDKQIEKIAFQLLQNRVIAEKLEENLALNKKQYERLAEEISKERLQKNQELIKIEQVKRQLQEINKNHLQKINQLQTQFMNQKDTLSQQISNFNLIIQRKQLLLSQNTYLIRQLTEKNTQNQQKIKKLNHQFINLENHYILNERALRSNIDEKILEQNKRQEQNNRQLQSIEKQLKRIKQEKAELQRQKLKDGQNFLDMIKDMNKSFKAKQQQMSQKNKIFEQTLQKIRKQSSQISKNMIDENNKQKSQISKLILVNEQKKKQIISLQLSLQRAEEHIKKVQNKFHANNIELTEKNVAYDFLFMQIQEEKAKVRNLENQLILLKQKKYQQEQHHSFLHSQNEIANKEESQNSKSRNRILSTSTIKQINNLKALLKNPTTNGPKQPIFQQSHEISLPMSHTNTNKQEIRKLSQSNTSINQIDQPIGDQQYSDPQKQLQIQQIQKPIKTTTILHHQLSDLVDQSEGQDEMIDLISSKNSNSSKMESSLGAFSQYSRLKSTQSAITHQEEQAQYSAKMKNSKMFAKLNRARKNKN